ncbi:7557_t:CDS:2 [Gigaspora margarita]|uniref:7557_t:CDS:1 n=1 Tax=Gigaspora margarita TaxID=4874 RepID=A0ABN7USG0_GIGMA|nr:7557_t:CDS:2 [Gigaspora margarita]
MEKKKTNMSNERLKLNDKSLRQFNGFYYFIAWQVIKAKHNKFGRH